MSITIATNLKHSDIIAINMAINYGHGKATISAGAKVVVCGFVGLVAALITGSVDSWQLAPLVGWEAAAAIYLGWTWLTVVRLDDSLTADFARREDPSRAVTDIMAVIASLASLVALGLVLTTGNGDLAHIALGVLSVVLSWVVIHTIFMLRYAELYYKDPIGGVEFDGVKQPSYADFAYLAFTMGMTFQVSDTGFQSTQFRTTALRHALLSYLFGTVIVATTVNLIAGLTK